MGPIDLAGWLSWYMRDGTFVDVQVSEPLVTVRLYNREYNVMATGNAKCDSSDTFSLDFGISLANSRALSRFTPRLTRKLIRSLNAS